MKLSFHCFFVILFILNTGCINKLPNKNFIGGYSVNLINQDDKKITFPKNYLGKTSIVTFIFTSCPDICPMTTHNMQLIQDKVKKENLKNVEFVAITFDPDRDKARILKSFALIRGIDLSNFNFFTGDINSIQFLMKKFNIVALPGDTTITTSGKLSYFFTHTDRLTLVDKNLNIRNTYSGSQPNIENIINDIKYLGN